ncbi:LysR family transcriptional regulator, partial [Pseudomonas sp. KHB2.9]
LMNKGVTYRPLVEVDACARLLVLTPTERPSALVDAFLSVIGEASLLRKPQ